MKITDGHIHIFSEINGCNSRGTVTGCGFGKIRNAGEEVLFMPPLTEKTCFTAGMLLEVLRQNSVERAVLMQNPTIGIVNQEIGTAVSGHPDILAGVVQVDPYGTEAAAQAEDWIRKYPFSAVKFEMSTGWGWTGIHHDSGFRYEKLYGLVDVAAQYNLAVVIDTGDTDSYGYLPDGIGKMADTYPQVKFVVEHAGYLTLGGDRELWSRMVKLGQKENVYLGICAAGSLLKDPYPCRKTAGVLHQIYNWTGAGKWIWGTDAPCTLKDYTYLQMIDYVSDSCGFLTETEKEQLFYKNADDVYFCRNR